MMTYNAEDKASFGGVFRKKYCFCFADDEFFCTFVA